MLRLPFQDKPLWVQALIWGVLILVVPGIIDLARGHGFFGQNTPPTQELTQPVDPQHPDRQWGPNGPRMSSKCDESKDCNTDNCHSKKY